MELENNDLTAEAPSTGTKKRERIVKRDTEHIYSASNDQGERYDSIHDEINYKRAVANQVKAERTAAIHALESQVLVPPRKNRGRPSKAYLEAQKAYEEALAKQQRQIDEARAALAGIVDTSMPETPLVESEEIAEPISEAALLPESRLIPNNHDAEEDIPDFIRMQRVETVVNPTNVLKDEAVEPVEAQKEADASPREVQIVSETTSDEQGESGSEESQDIENVDSTDAPNPKSENQEEGETESENTDLELLKWLTGAYHDGQRFIIDEDVPKIDSGVYMFASEITPTVNDLKTSDSGLAMQDTEDSYGVTHDPYSAIREEEHVSVRTEHESKLTNDNTTADRSEQSTLQRPAIQEIVIEAEGVAEIDNQGNAYLRSSDYNYMPSPDDIFVTQAQVRAHSIKMGDVVSAKVRAPREGEKYYTVREITAINGCSPSLMRDRVPFEHLTPLFPEEQFHLSKRGEKSPISCRVVDLFAPIGKGQRALIVAPPKTGKTVLLKQIANAIAAHHPETYLMMLLIDERPEEVTDMARTVNAEVIASTFDEPAKRHVRIAGMVLEKAKRLVECGHDVVIFLDSITRLARAFNTEAPTSGKILSGGVEANALQRPKRFFGAARNIENGGSLTIIATALIDTGSRMDEVIFEEFKGTGNMELVLDRSLANKRVFPAVNLVQSSTRREDLLFDELTIARLHVLRNFLADYNPSEAISFVRKYIDSTISNEEFIEIIPSMHP